MPPKRLVKQCVQAPPQGAGKPVTNAAKKKEYNEEDMQKALYACSNDNPDRISITQASEDFVVPYSSLTARRRGRMTRTEAHVHQQHLTKEEEAGLAMYCENRGWRGEPVDLAEIREMAQSICRKNIGENWVYAFLERHPEVVTRWAKNGESKRASGLNRSNVDSFFQALAEAKQGVDPDCIWNCDEKGLQANGGSIRKRVIVARGQKDPKITADENKKMVTMLECVNATGGAISPLLIHEGAEKDAEWIRSNPCGAAIAASPNGWTDGDAARQWLETVFEPQTEKVAKGRKRLLILDGHNSHCTLDFIIYAARKNITILLLPPHTTHCLQPLDVNVFSHLACEWRKYVKDWSKRGYKVSKNNFLSIYSKARKAALTKSNICKAFEQCGIVPYNPSIISEQDIAPAETTSVIASQPIRPTLPIFMDALEVIPEHPPRLDTPPVFLDDDIAALNPALCPSGPTLIPLRDVTNLAASRPLEHIAVHRNNRPNPPSKYASKSELQQVVNLLFGLLDDDDKALAAGYAREVLAQHENGRLREKQYGKTHGRAKTTHLKTGARILTAEASIAAMTEVNRKRVLAMIIKEMKPLAKHREKFETALARERDGKLVQAEKVQIEIATRHLKEVEKSVKSVEAKIKTVRDMLTKANERQANSTTASAIKRAEDSCKTHRSKLAKLNSDLVELLMLCNTAEAAYTSCCAERQQRLDRIAEAEAEFNAAQAQENLVKQLEKERIDAEAARRAKLPKRTTDPSLIWKPHFETMVLSSISPPNNDENYLLPVTMPRLEFGTFLRQTEVEAPQDFAAVELNEHLAEEYGHYIDAELIGQAAVFLTRPRGGSEDQV